MFAGVKTYYRDEAARDEHARRIVIRYGKPPRTSACEELPRV